MYVKGGACQIPGRNRGRAVKIVGFSHDCAVYSGHLELYQYHECQPSGQTAGICRYGGGGCIQKADEKPHCMGRDLVFPAYAGTVCYGRVQG